MADEVIKKYAKPAFCSLNRSAFSVCEGGQQTAGHIVRPLTVKNKTSGAYQVGESIPEKSSVEDILSYILGESFYEFEEGKDGKSAYEIAVENGYTGNEEDWLKDIKGATFTPEMVQTQSDRVTIRFTNDKELANPNSVTIIAPKGKDGVSVSIKMNGAIVPNTNGIVDLGTIPTSDAIEQMIEDMLGTYVTEEQLNTAVGSAVTEATKNFVTNAQLTTAVDSAVSTATADFVTNTQLNTAVGSAVTEATRNFVTNTQLTTAVDSAVSTATADFVTEDELITAVDDAVSTVTQGFVTENELPTKLPTPFSLTFTGASTASFNGSKAVTINIPEGGGGSYTLPPASSSVLGGIKANLRTAKDTKEVKIDSITQMLYVEPNLLSAATASVLGGIKANPKTAEDTQEVKMDPVTNILYTKPTSGGGSGGIADVPTTPVNVSYVRVRGADGTSAWVSFIDPTQRVTDIETTLGDFATVSVPSATDIVDAINKTYGSSIKSVTVNGSIVEITNGSIDLGTLVTNLNGYSTTVQVEELISTANENKADLVDGKVPISQLPEGLDDFVEVNTYEDLPVEGKASILYVILTGAQAGRGYRWSGTMYVPMFEAGGGSLTLGETAETAYRGDRGKLAYEHTLVTSGNPHGITASTIGLDNLNNASKTAFNIGLPTDTVFGGIKASAKTAEDTVEVKIDATTGKGYVKPSGGLSEIPIASADTFGGIKAGPTTGFENVEVKVNPGNGRAYVQVDSIEKLIVTFTTDELLDGLFYVYPEKEIPSATCTVFSVEIGEIGDRKTKVLENNFIIEQGTLIIDMNGIAELTGNWEAVIMF